MSEFHISDEGMESLWIGMARHLDQLAGSKGIDQHFVKLLCHQFLREPSNRGHDIFEVVTAPTGRASVYGLCVRFSRAFDAYAALAAKDRYGLNSH